MPTVLINESQRIIIIADCHRIQLRKNKNNKSQTIFHNLIDQSLSAEQSC